MIAPAPQAPEVEATDSTETHERPLVLRVLLRWRSALVLLPLLAGLLFAGSLGATKLWADLPEKSAPAPDVTCWNGTVGPATSCTVPAEVAGLRWVFPSFRPARDACPRIERKERKQERPVEFGCTASLDQNDISIVYSVRTSVEQGLAFLSRRYDGITPVETARGERLAFRDPVPANGRYFLTVAYADYPFAVTIDAPTRVLRDRALAELVVFRPVADLFVRPDER